MALDGKLLFVAIMAGVMATSGYAREKQTVANEPRVERMTVGPVEVTLLADPPAVHLDRDLLFTIRVTAPDGMQITMPAIADRLSGFTLGGSLDEEPVSKDGKTVYERRTRLTPLLSQEYRIAPMVIRYSGGLGVEKEEWFATRPLVLDPVPPFEGKPGKDIDSAISPVWIYPPPATIVLYVILFCLMLVMLYLGWRLLKKAHRAIKLMRMSPRERALHELAELLAKDLIGKHLVKEFYLELTLIVRSYIERAHAIKAPEQTTEEFLIAVSRDPRFKEDTVRKLKHFLEAADLVKFAAYTPEAQSIENATRTAREYVESDSTVEAGRSGGGNGMKA